MKPVPWLQQANYVHRFLLHVIPLVSAIVSRKVTISVPREGWCGSCVNDRDGYELAIIRTLFRNLSKP